MATNLYKKYTESKTREWAVASGTQSGTVVLNASGEVGVTITARGDSTKSVTLPDGTVLTGVKNGGVGNRPGGAVVAVDGTWLLAVSGVANGDTGAGGAGTDEGTKVYRLTAGPNTISLTATGGVLIGVIDDGVIVGGVAPVKIGANI
jgi:hypothetical protein